MALQATTGARLETKTSERQRYQPAVAYNSRSRERGIRNVSVVESRKTSGYLKKQYTDYNIPANDNYTNDKRIDKKFREESAKRGVATLDAGIVNNQRNLRREKSNVPETSAQANSKYGDPKSSKNNQPSKTTKSRRRIRRAGPMDKISKTATRAVANFVNMFVQPVLGVYYTLLQLPLALLSLLFLAIAVAVRLVTENSAVKTAVDIMENATITIPFVSWVFSIINLTTSDLYNTITSLLNPETWAIALLFIVGSLNMLFLLGTYLTFYYAGKVIPDGKPGSSIEPLFGEKGTVLKFSALVAVIGCSFMPLTNLIPVLNIWAFIVSRFPR